MNTRPALFGAAIAMLTACATSAPPPARVAAVPPAAVAAPAPGTAPTAATPATAATLAPAAVDTHVIDADKKAREMGYHVEMRHGDRFFCRTVVPTGSLISKKECLTESTMEQQAQMMEQDKARLMQSHSCLGAGCNIN